MASELSALSHGHYKAAIFYPTLIKYDYMMRSFPLEFGFAPSQWLSITDIQLMHPEFQINNKLVDEKVLANAEVYNEVAEEQHGSRKHSKGGFWFSTKSLFGTYFVSLEDQVTMV